MLQVPAAPDGVCVIELVGRIGLPAERVVALVGPLRNAVVKQIADRVGLEGQAGIASAERALPIERILGVLPAQDRIAGQLALILVQTLAWESRLAVDREAQVRLQAVQVGNLERVVGGAEDQRQSIASVEDVLEIAEAVVLRRVIVNWIGAAVG